MGIFYLNVATVSRSAGRRAVVAAAYCSRSKLHDEGLGRDIAFSETSDLRHSEILLPSGAPERWLDRAVLWNEIERVESRENAQLAREVELVISREISIDEGVKLGREFLLEQFVERGMIVDFNIHLASAADGKERVYVQALFSMREITGDRFGKKRTDWKETNLLLKWRERWALLTNKHLIDAGRNRLIGAGASGARGRQLEPLRSGDANENAAENHETVWRNGGRLLAEPGLALDALTHEKETFTRRELVDFVRRNTAGDEQYNTALARVESSIDLVRLPGGESFSTRRLIGSVDWASASDVNSDRESDRTLKEAVALWEAAGRRVRGVGLTYEMAKAFEKKTGIKSVAVHGLLGRWKKKQDRLLSDDVLVVNDVAQLSSRQKEWMLKASRAATARLVFVDGVRFLEINSGEIGLEVEQLAAFDR
jgi:hypothetical protein